MRIALLICLLILTSAVAPAASPAPATADALASAQLKALAQPSATVWRASVVAFDNALGAYCAGQQKNGAPLLVLRQRWYASFEQWARFSALPVAALQGRRSTAGFIDGTVIDAILIERFAKDASLRGANLETLPMQTRGYGALAHLLWFGTGAALPPFDGAGEAKVKDPVYCAYARVLSADLVKLATHILDPLPALAAAPGRIAKPAVSGTPTESLLETYVDGLRGVTRSQQAYSGFGNIAVDAGGARKQHQPRLGKLQAITLAQAILGADKNSPSLIGFLQASGHTEHIEVLRAGAKKLLADAQALPDSLAAASVPRDQIGAALILDADALQKILTGPIADSYGAVVGIGDGDGG
jgi:hypothetical protein